MRWLPPPTHAFGSKAYAAWRLLDPCRRVFFLPILRQSAQYVHQPLVPFMENTRMVYLSIFALIASAFAALLGFPALAALAAGVAQLSFSTLELQLHAG